MGAILQAMADRIGDTSTLIVAVLAFGIGAALVALAIKGLTVVVGHMRAGIYRSWWLAAAGAAAALLGWQLLGSSHHGTPSDAQAQPGLSRVPVHTGVVERKPFPIVLN